MSVFDLCVSDVAWLHSWCSSCNTKLAAKVVVIGAVVLLIKELFDIYLWDSHMHVHGPCSEAHYVYEDYIPQPDVFHDSEHIRRCQEAFDNRKPRKYGPDDEFYIKTKCGYVKPVLQSWKEQIRTEAESEENVVPNIVHFLVFRKEWTFSFLDYLSFSAASKFIQPEHIFLHGNVLPMGPWWVRLLTETPNIYYVYREQPLNIQGQNTGQAKDSSNLLRAQTLYGE